MIVFPIVPVIAYVSTKYHFKMQQKVSQSTLQKSPVRRDLQLGDKTSSLHDNITYDIWCTGGTTFLGGYTSHFECQYYPGRVATWYS